MKIQDVLKYDNMHKKYEGLNEVWIVDIGSSQLDLLNSDDGEPIAYYHTLLDILGCDFEEVIDRKAVTFDEVLNSNKRCRVEHKELELTLKQTKCTTDYVCDIVDDYIEGKFLTLGEVIVVIGWMCNSNSCGRIISEGKWYLKP